jgi:hypothetical protein
LVARQRNGQHQCGDNDIHGANVRPQNVFPGAEIIFSRLEIRYSKQEAVANERTAAFVRANP